jgi:hypothetical protein
VLDDRERGVLFLAVTSDFTIARSLKTGSGARKLFYPAGIGEVSLRLVWLKSEAEESRLSCTEVKNLWSRALTLVHLSFIKLN